MCFMDLTQKPLQPDQVCWFGFLFLHCLTYPLLQREEERGFRGLRVSLPSLWVCGFQEGRSHTLPGSPGLSTMPSTQEVLTNICWMKERRTHRSGRAWVIKPEPELLEAVGWLPLKVRKDSGSGYYHHSVTSLGRGGHCLPCPEQRWPGNSF